MQPTQCPRRLPLLQPRPCRQRQLLSHRLRQYQLPRLLPRQPRLIRPHRTLPRHLRQSPQLLPAQYRQLHDQRRLVPFSPLLPRVVLACLFGSLVLLLASAK